MERKKCCCKKEEDELVVKRFFPFAFFAFFLVGVFYLRFVCVFFSFFNVWL